MKIKIEFDDSIDEEEVIIRCSELSDKIQNIQRTLSELNGTVNSLVFYKHETEFYLSLDQILFFETGSDGVSAHTLNDIFQTRYKLYELEELLPGYFMRISKSAYIVRRLQRSLTLTFLSLHHG